MHTITKKTEKLNCNSNISLRIEHIGNSYGSKMYVEIKLQLPGKGAKGIKPLQVIVPGWSGPVGNLSFKARC
nr:hypothetical protein [Flavobacterium sp. ASV13]